MQIVYQNIVLRDFQASDVEDYVRWFTVQTEWLDWDEPWDPVQTDEARERARWNRCLAEVQALAPEAPRRRLEIEHAGRHLGCVITYPVNEQGEWIPADRATPAVPLYPAVGIDICEPGFSGQGIGTQALHAFVQSLAERGCHKVYLSTWSGNLRMMHRAQKLGFALCRRIPGCRMVRGRQYDDIVYQLIL